MVEEDDATARDAIVELALAYPFERPDGDFMFRNGAAESLPEDFSIGEHTTAVLGYGSNAAPSQLRRKYGTDGSVPVLSVEVSGLDAVYCVGISHYGSVPATVSRADGVVMRGSVTLLDDAQLAHMHRTERGYVYCRLRRDAGVSIAWRGVQIGVEVFAYVAPRLLVQGAPVALAEIAARGRTSVQWKQREMNGEALRMSGWDETLEEFIARNVGDAGRRHAVQAVMAGSMADEVEECWEALDQLGTLLGWEERNK